MSPRELLDAVWPNTHVSMSALSSALRDLRRALRDTDAQRPIVATLRGRGYRFVADVTLVSTCEQPALDRVAAAVLKNLHRLSRGELHRLAALVGVEA